jgi:hypothetical protein
MFLDGEPDCDTVCTTVSLPGQGDVSERNGVRCKGDGCSPPWEGGVQEMEVNNGQGVHFTIYGLTSTAVVFLEKSNC